MASSTPDPSRGRQLDLLQVVCCLAWADGSVDGKERQLLEQIVKQVAGAVTPDSQEALPHDQARQLAAWEQGPEQLDAVVPRIRAQGDGALAVKLAHMMALASQRPEDSSAINPEERLAYRRLVEGLGLGADEVEEAEWAARQELASGRSFWTLLGDALSAFGAWPAPEVLDNPAMQWL
jgi:hypothetical protein